MTGHGSSLSDVSIQRVLFVASKVHVYTVPPLRSTKGYQASTWTTPSPHDPNPAREIFLARLRILETATPAPVPVELNSKSLVQVESDEDLSVSILLEDPATGDLFAEAPYSSLSVVEPATDSSRFFAVRVVGPGSGSNAKPVTAILGIGFEDRGESMEFGICLQSCEKLLKLAVKGGGSAGATRTASGSAAKGKAVTETGQGAKRDWSLKEGESIKVDIGLRRSRRTDEEAHSNESVSEDRKAALFSIKPPPGPTFSDSGGTDESKEGSADISIPLLAPPPNAPMSRAEKRRSREIAAAAVSQQKKDEVQALGFDDGEFGEFQ